MKLLTTTVHLVSPMDFDALVMETFNKPYSAVQAVRDVNNGELVRIDISPEALAAMDEEDMIDWDERFEAWSANPNIDSVRRNSPEWYRATNLSPDPTAMAIKLRERGAELPDQFTMEIWW